MTTKMKTTDGKTQSAQPVKSGEQDATRLLDGRGSLINLAMMKRTGTIHAICHESFIGDPLPNSAAARRGIDSVWWVGLHHDGQDLKFEMSITNVASVVQALRSTNPDRLRGKGIKIEVRQVQRGMRRNSEKWLSVHGNDVEPVGLPGVSAKE